MIVKPREKQRIPAQTRAKARSRLLLRLLSVVVALAALAACAAWFAGGLLIGSSHRNVGGLPAEIAGEAVEFPSTSGAMLHGWLLRAERSRGSIILMHGLRADRLAMLGRARFLSAERYSVLLFDFQAHGDSSGDKITFGYLESKDAQAAVDLIRLELPGQPVGVIGVSMGGAAALLASPRLDVDAMVLEEVYPDIKTAIADRLQMAMGGWARILTPLLSLQMEPRLGVSAEIMRPVDRIREIQVPKFLIAGSEDRHTTLEESRRLFEAAAEPKELWVVQGAAHTDMCSFAPAEYTRRILAFFAATLRPMKVEPQI